MVNISLSLVFQNPLVIPCEDRCLDPLKAEPQEVFVNPNTDPHKVFGRLGLFIGCYTSQVLNAVFLVAINSIPRFRDLELHEHVYTIRAHTIVSEWSDMGPL